MDTIQEAPVIVRSSRSRAKLDRLAAWFDAEYAGLLRFAYFVCGDRDEAQDLVQEAFVRLYRAAGRIDDVTVGAYARRTIVNLGRSGARRRRTPGPVRPEATPPHDPGARDEVWRAMAALSPKQRAVVALRYYEDMSEKDIAGALGMSTGSVKKHADRALTRLRALLPREER